MVSVFTIAQDLSLKTPKTPYDAYQDSVKSQETSRGLGLENQSKQLDNLKKAQEAEFNIMLPVNDQASLDRAKKTLKHFGIQSSYDVDRFDPQSHYEYMNRLNNKNALAEFTKTFLTNKDKEVAIAKANVDYQSNQAALNGTLLANANPKNWEMYKPAYKKIIGEDLPDDYESAAPYIEMYKNASSDAALKWAQASNLNADQYGKIIEARKNKLVVPQNIDDPSFTNPYNNGVENPQPQQPEISKIESPPHSIKGLSGILNGTPEENFRNELSTLRYAAPQDKIDFNKLGEHYANYTADNPLLQEAVKVSTYNAAPPTGNDILAMKIRSLAKDINPSWNDEKANDIFKSREQARNEFEGGGQTAENMRAFNRFVHHVDLLSKVHSGKIDANEALQTVGGDARSALIAQAELAKKEGNEELANSKLKAANNIVNIISTHIGQATPSIIKGLTQIVSAEQANALGGKTATERGEGAVNIDYSLPDDAYQKLLKKYLIDPAFDAYKENDRTRVDKFKGLRRPYDQLSPDVKKILARFGKNAASNAQERDELLKGLGR